MAQTLRQRRYWAQLITVKFGGKEFMCSRRTYSALRYLNARLAVKHPNANGPGKPAYVRVIQGCYMTKGNPGYSPKFNKSAGTHDFDGTLDVEIVGLTWDQGAYFVKWYGWMAWHRKPPKFGHHIHMTLVPLGITSNKPSLTMIVNAYHNSFIRVGAFVPGQVDDGFDHSLGLAGQHRAGNDPAPYPPNLVKRIYDPSKKKAA